MVQKSQKSSTDDLFSKNLCTLISKSDLKQILFGQIENEDEENESQANEKVQTPTTPTTTTTANTKSIASIEQDETFLR